jgi:hypothetical protein
MCALKAKKRWMLTASDVTSGEFDFFAAVKFLRCEDNNENSPIGQALLNTIMLRRTKQHIIDKSYQKIDVLLNCEERLVYRKMMSFSQKILFYNKIYCKKLNDEKVNFTLL